MYGEGNLTPIPSPVEQGRAFPQASSCLRYWTAGLVAAALALLTACGGGGQHAPALPANERLLFSFERKTMLPMYAGTASRAIASEHATNGQHSLRLKFSPGRETIILDTGGFPMDWRGWRALKMDVYRKGAPLLVNLRITDAQGKRHWIWSKQINPGANTLSYDVPSLSGRIDLSAVTELMWYAEQPSGEIYIDAIRLSR
ncbi:MAG: hypothetical protein RMM08_12195 [Armatimonadota bacterium]|nr:hypothetical protein [Armatimonadota bacterium]